MTNKQLIRFVRAREKELASTRDKIQKVIDNLEELSEVAERAREAMEEAAQVLSERV